jgi:hypothetical protein
MYSIEGLEQVPVAELISGNVYVCDSDFSCNVVIFDRITDRGGYYAVVWGDWYPTPDDAHRRVNAGATNATMPLSCGYYSLEKFKRKPKGFAKFIQRVEGKIDG